MKYTIQAEGVKVTVKAGEFNNCIKVKQQMEGLPSWIYEYYAPWTGKVLTSVAGPGFENRVTELLKYGEAQPAEEKKAPVAEDKKPRKAAGPAAAKKK